MMIRTLAVLALAVSPLLAEEAAKPAEAPKAESAATKVAAGFKTWLQHLREGLAESAVGGRRQKTRVTAVAAVRGAGQDSVDPEKPAWKSTAEAKKAKADKAEKAELASAIDTVLAGNLAEGRDKLAAFEKAHPDSALAKDAKEARVKVEEELKGAKE